MTPKANKKKKREPLFETGEFGANRVWLYRRGKKRTFYLGWYERAPNGAVKRCARSLGNVTLSEAKVQAEEVAQRLRRGILPSNQKDLTLGDLFTLYQREKTPFKGDSARRHDLRAMPLFLKCWGAHRPVIELKPMDWEHYIRQRRSGVLAPPGRSGGPVRDRTLEQDLSLLRAILHWAVANELIEKVPMSQCKIPREKNVARPIVYEEEVTAFQAVANLVHPRCLLALLLTHETGRRLQSARELRWSDIDLDHGTVRWPAETDKEGKEHTSPASDDLLAELRRHYAPGQTLLFPSSRTPDQPLNRKTFDDWWAEMERLAGVEHVPRRKWHSTRRKWATERKHMPPADVAAAGGWNGTQTLTKVYIQPDEATMRQVITNRIPLRKPSGPLSAP